MESAPGVPVDPLPLAGEEHQDTSGSKTPVAPDDQDNHEEEVQVLGHEKTSKNTASSDPGAVRAPEKEEIYTHVELRRLCELNRHHYAWGYNSDAIDKDIEDECDKNGFFHDWVYAPDGDTVNLDYTSNVRLNFYALMFLHCSSGSSASRSRQTCTRPRSPLCSSQVRRKQQGHCVSL